MIQKLRAWNKKNAWYINSGNPFTLQEAIYGIVSRDFLDELEFEYYAQSNDINGKEIYQGDIVRLATDEIGGTIADGFVGIVRFNEGGFWAMNDELQLSFSVWQEIAQWEIIGNIHEGVENATK